MSDEPTCCTCGGPVIRGHHRTRHGYGGPSHESPSDCVAFVRSDLSARLAKAERCACCGGDGIMRLNDVEQPCDRCEFGGVRARLAKAEADAADWTQSSRDWKYRAEKAEAERDAAIADAEQARTVPMIGRVISETRHAALTEAAEVCEAMARKCRDDARSNALGGERQNAYDLIVEAQALEAGSQAILALLTPAAGGGDRG